MSSLSHVGEDGRARMVDVGDKPITARAARAEGNLICDPATLTIVAEGRAPKGAVVQTAELAGIMGAKRTAELIPLCHPISVTKVAITIGADPELPGFRIAAEVRTSAQTGVEMEALTAVSVAALTLFDMLKAIDRTMVIGEIKVLEKSGGRSGTWS